MTKKYGKPSGPLFKYKMDFFTNNEEKVRSFQNIADIYARQPRRSECKNCLYPLGKPDFVKSGIEYIICERCGHLNGAHEDTDSYCQILYTDDDGENYSADYKSISREIYENRVNDIYVPKAAFLFQSLEKEGESPFGLSYADLGAGAGYFVSALSNLGAKKVNGYEVSASLVKLAKSLGGIDVINQHPIEETENIASGVDVEVVSLIGVLEHLQRPRELLSALRANPSVKYLFFSLPLFSPSVFFEIAAPDVMPRQLGQDHTHLYTESSIRYFCREFSLEAVSEWWFGGDIMDLYRTVWVRMASLPHSERMEKEWERFFGTAIDDLQLALDKRHACSEVHLVLKVLH